METMTFKVSAEAIRQNRQRYLVLQLAAPVLLALGVLVDPRMQKWTLGHKAIFFVLVVAAVELVQYIQWSSLYRKMQRAEVSLTKNTIEYKGRKLTASVKYRDIGRLDIRKSKSGEILFIEVWATTYLEYRTVALHLYGLEEMETIAKQLEVNTRDNMSVGKSVQGLYWTSPFVVVAIAAAMLLGQFIVRALGPGTWGDLIDSLLFGLMGSLLIFHPIAPVLD